MPPTRLSVSNFAVYPEDVHEVICHRVKDGDEEFLIRWRNSPSHASYLPAVCSWHSLDEVRLCLHLVQLYLEAAEVKGYASAIPSQLRQPKRKRKSPGADAPSRDLGRHTQNGLLAPSPSLSTPVTTSALTTGPDVYNGVIWRYLGRFKPHRRGPQLDTITLPTPGMRAAAAFIPTPQSALKIREAFLARLSPPDVDLVNNVDSSTPPLNFKFIDSYELGQGVNRALKDTQVGCQQCKPNMGQNVGCEYTAKCDCLEFAEVDEDNLRRNPAKFAEYRKRQAKGDTDTSGFAKRFPYTKPNSEDPSVPCTLVKHYLESRQPIYECNDSCKCGPRCKNRLVQNGRKIPLSIFRTVNRGWGLRCREDLVRGEFIDTYLGELLPNEEAGRREDRGGIEKNSYLMSLDKFAEEDSELTVDTCYVVDGQYKGGVSRFINHSCEPNCRLYAVSYNKHDVWVYDLAFFALEDIPDGTELTFDYLDRDEEEEEDAIRKREEAAKDPANHDKVLCNCGMPKCRGYLWV